MGAAYEPFALSRGRRLFAPYINDDHRRVQIEDRYDYTTFDHRWYGDALLDGAMWNEPLENSEGQGMEALYTVPFARPGTREPWDGFLKNLYQQWGSRWFNPGQ